MTVPNEPKREDPRPVLEGEERQSKDGGTSELHHIKYSKKNPTVHIMMEDQPVPNANKYHKEIYKIKDGTRQECIPI